MGRTRSGVDAYLSLSLTGREVGWRWALIKFFCLQDGRLFEVGANSRLGAYSNKYGISRPSWIDKDVLRLVGTKKALWKRLKFIISLQLTTKHKLLRKQT